MCIRDRVTNAKEFFIAFNKFLTNKGVTLIELITNSKDLSTRLSL